MIQRLLIGVRLLAAMFLFGCGDESADNSLPPCDCTPGTVCDEHGECVMCTNSNDTCNTSDNCNAGAACTSLAGVCGCVAPGSVLSDEQADLFVEGDQSNRIAGLDPGLDIERVVLTCERGVLRVNIQLYGPWVRTSNAGYWMVLTSTTAGAPPAGMLGNGRLALTYEGTGASLRCFSLSYTAGDWVRQDPPAGADCDVGENAVVLSYPVASAEALGPDAGLRIYTQQSFDYDGDGTSDVVLDLTDEADAFPSLCTP